MLNWLRRIFELVFTYFVENGCKLIMRFPPSELLIGLKLIFSFSFCGSMRTGNCQSHFEYILKKLKTKSESLSEESFNEELDWIWKALAQRIVSEIPPRKHRFCPYIYRVMAQLLINLRNVENWLSSADLVISWI